jgi:hypothetical protein
MGRAWIVFATFPAESRYDRFRKECNAGVFVMDCITLEESRALRSVFIATILFCLTYSRSIIYKLDVERVVENFTKWGPSARTCLMLAWGTLTEKELQFDVGIVAKKFAKDPTATTMEANPEVGSDLLFTFPDDPERGTHTLRVATQHLYGFVVQAIAAIDAAKQVSFYARASGHPSFGAFDYIFEKYFYVWLSSNPLADNELLCTAAKSASRSASTGSTAHEQAKQLFLRLLRPVGWEKVIVHRGESDERGYETANEHQTPFAWIPVSRSDATFDAVTCTDTNIITIQVTVAAEHDVKEEGFKKVKQDLPKQFQKARSWCHVFVTNRHDTAAELGRKTYTIADKMDISIHTAFLDISLFKFTPEVLKHAKAPRCK